MILEAIEPDPDSPESNALGTSRRGGSRARFRRWLINLHLYGGIFSVGYLIPLGISSLQFNHAYGFTEGFRATASWTTTVELSPAADDLARAEAVRAELGFVGWALPWTLSREEEGVLRFEISNPGRHYLVRLDETTGGLEIQENRKKIWAVFRALHGGGQVPGSTPTTLWWLYMNLSVAIVLFSAASGVYLWAVSGRDRGLGWAAMGAASVIFGAFFVYLAT